MKRTDFAAELARRRADAGLSLADLAARAHVHRGHIHRIERGERWPSYAVAAALDAALDADDALMAIWEAADRAQRALAVDGQPTELLELGARAKASDVPRRTLELVDRSVDGLARSYTRVPPDELLCDVRTRARQIGRLLDGRATLTERRRLLTNAGWLALLAATLHVDLGQRGPASSARAVAGALGRETEHDEISSWGAEIDTWGALVDQDWGRAAASAAAGEGLAPKGSPAAAQLAMQAARASARLGDGTQVRAALRRAEVALEQQSADRPPDHHFYFDGDKYELYTGTTLAWLGDPAAEDIARQVAAHYQTSGRRRRLTTAYLDLGLVLARLGRPDEAAHFGALALGTNHLVPSNSWRADELIAAVSEFRGVPEVEELREMGAQRALTVEK